MKTTSILHKEQMTLTLSRRRGVKKGQKYGLDKTRKYVYKPVNKELMGSSSGRNSVVECQLPKLDVGGSNPLARFFWVPHRSFAKWHLGLAE